MRTALVIIALASSIFVSGCGRPTPSPEVQLQEDYDHLRLEHLEFWTALIEEYESKTGYFPFQKKVTEASTIGHVQILPPNSEDLIVDWGDSFHELRTNDLVSLLESELERKVSPRYPPESETPNYAFAYNYFVEPDGYLLWVTCQSCGITEISTYTMDGKSATVNIASSKMTSKVTKALTRKDMLSHPQYFKWRSIDLHNEVKMRKLENRFE